MSDVIKEMKEKMDHAVQGFSKNLATVRAGRANPKLLDSITVEYYGAYTPLNQLANISAPEPRLLVITPYDKTAVGEIEKAILKADIGLTPSNDGDLIRISIPALTEERRKELVKIVNKYTEEARVQVRNVRREANEQYRKAEKNGDLTEDELHTSEDNVQKQTDKYVAELEKLAENKESEIMEV